MKTIWKYELKIADTETVIMPKGASILCVQIQYVTPCVWALVDPEEEEGEEHHFEMFGTGFNIREKAGIKRKYIGTIQIPNTGLVFHLFERIK
jgi:hypothetical protein